MWDETTEFGARVSRRLAQEEVIWLVTTGSDGTPQPSPVWFLREGNSLLIYSKPDTPKLRNIAARPRVALHFNTDPTGEDVVIFLGTATIIENPPLGSEVPAYLEKYREGVERIGMDPAAFATTYSAAIRVELEKVRGF